MEILLLLVLAAFIGVWAYNRYRATVEKAEAGRTFEAARRPPTREQRLKAADDYSENPVIVLMARTAADRLYLGTTPGADRDQWTTAAETVFRRVPRQIVINGASWMVSVDAMAKEIEHVVAADPKSSSEEYAASFTAYLGAVAAEGFAKASTAGPDAAAQLLLRLGGEG